jgi:hypothetical protein
LGATVVNGIESNIEKGHMNSIAPPPTTPKRRTRWLRFRIRTLFLVMTLVALTTHAGRQWWVTRLEYLIEKQSCFIDEHRYVEAEAVADLALHLYPEHPIAKCMLQLAASCRAVDESIGSGSPHYADELPSEDLLFIDASKWEELSRQRSQIEGLPNP